MTSDELTALNETLHRDYGESFGVPRFRLAWSENQFELRMGAVNVFYGNIFLREEKGIHNVRKYNYLKDKWILEEVMNSFNHELEKTVNYEPIWVFQDSKGNYLEPILRAIRLIIYTILNPQKKSPTFVKDLEDEAMKKEYEFFLDYFKNESEYIPSMLHNREAIISPGVPRPEISK